MINRKYLKGIVIIAFLLLFIFISCYRGPPNIGTQNTIKNTQKLLVVLTDESGNTILDSRIIDGNINDKFAIEQFAKNLARNPGYSYIGGTWNEYNQFLGVVNTPAGKMLMAIREAD